MHVCSLYRRGAASGCGDMVNMGKNNTDVVIDDKVYTISGDQDAAYVRQLAAYVNEKLEMVHGRQAYSKQPYGVRHMLVLMNIADDYFKMKQQAEEAKRSYEKQEAEFYNMKCEMVNMQLAMERMRQTLQEERKVTADLCPYLKALESASHKEACAADLPAGRKETNTKDAAKPADDVQEEVIQEGSLPEGMNLEKQAEKSGFSKKKPPYELFARNGIRK